MVAGVHFYATGADEVELLDYLDEPTSVRLFPWGPMKLSGPTFLERADIGGVHRLGVLNPDLGAIELIRPHDPEFNLGAKSRVFNHINWNAFNPAPDEGMVDWNRTPALYWQRARSSDETLTISDLGSQADSMAKLSDEYRKWANRSMNWIRRKSTPVWERTSTGGQSAYDVSLPILNTVYALPGALAFLESGGRGRYHES